MGNTVTIETIESSLEPKYRINMVADMIGVTAANLRAWERRYGIPKPQRAGNSYRLYSEEDVKLLRKMKALCEAGHAPSNASKLAFAEIEQEEQVEIKAYPGLEELKRKLVNATIEFDSVAIDRTLQHAATLESAWIIYQELIEPALCEIGDLWEQDASYLANEHLLSHSVKSAMVQFLKVLRPPKPRKRVLLACVQDELHDIPLYALAIRCAHAGCLPIIIGANTPPVALKNAVEHTQPDLIVLSATTALYCHQQVQDMDEAFYIEPSFDIVEQINLYREACGKIPWLIGGRSEQTWTSLPDDLRKHVSSNKADLDRLLA